MARPLRIEYPDAVYHVMNRGLARQATFRTPADYETFLQVLGETHTLRGQGSRALSDGNHYHLCLRTTNPIESTFWDDSASDPADEGLPDPEWPALYDV